MTMTDGIQEFGFDCKIRKLSQKTISNYQKQLKYYAITCKCAQIRRSVENTGFYDVLS